MTSSGEVVVGVLALQGAFKQHVQLFEKIGVKATEIRTPEELAEVDALVLPGGESTAIALVARRTGLGQELIGGFPGVVHRNFFGSQLGSFSAMLESPLNVSDGDAVSSEAAADTASSKQYRAVFIRAPVLIEYDDAVNVLAKVVPHKESQEADAKVDAHEPIVVAASHGNILMTSFHPELTDDASWHQYFFNFATKVIKAAPGGAAPASSSSA
ncbi:Pyridoxal 5'-phosphate synthase subunit SNO1 [Hondaea fermentalgiana]|uniref:glutaminase n=1 Tax=Hondaea fermentalgiana TaxID=2315210 RepID=A0A2R5H0J3_9STRA|nr:Pyridoxal 5'-phosphate synthase subunit SNO1 [Hondaea fermentalgiana]|eukprot:GBG33834.1 Pyridoxal 5'-phosphate synthase subunit SNO1 [Hondaea fermentalgiana]